MSNPSIKIHGMDRLIKKMEPSLVAAPVSRFMRKSGYVVMARAIVNARPHIFDGGVNNAFIVEVGPGLIPRRVEIANTIEHAVYLEMGTRPHFPPVDAITPWALAHGFDPYALALHIAMFGTKAHPFLEPALEDSKPAIMGLLALCANEIESRNAI